MVSRKHRVWYPGASYHITARGNRRTALFEGEQDYLMYLAILEDVRRMDSLSFTLLLFNDQSHSSPNTNEKRPY